MRQSITTLLVLLLGLPLLVVIAAHVSPPDIPAWIGSGVIYGATAIGLLVITKTPWRRPVRVAAGIAYLLRGIFILPWIVIAAACTPNNCI
jgi:hypothetical protein